MLKIFSLPRKAVEVKINTTILNHLAVKMDEGEQPFKFSIIFLIAIHSMQG